MAFSVTHTFVDAIPDDPAAAAAGKVLPSHWNADHTLADIADQTALGNISGSSGPPTEIPIASLIGPTGATGATGPTGPTGATGPAPGGTGMVYVAAGTPAVTGLTSTRVPYANSNGILTDSANLTWDGTAIYIGAPTPVSDELLHAAGGSTSGQKQIRSHNTSNGTGSQSGFAAMVNSTTIARMHAYGPNYSTTGVMQASGGGYYSSGSGASFFGNSSSGSVYLISGGTATTNVRVDIDTNGNVAIGNAALATNATNGFLYIPTCAGAPSGTPTSKTGRVPLVYDTTNNNLYIYNGGWKKTTTFA